MTVAKHSLHNDFPEMAAAISELKTSDAHFARLFEDYDSVEHEVHNIENGVENTSDEYLEELKKRRVQLKDQLYAILQSHSAPKESCCGCCGN
ncbi:MAG: YdcH family protein [Hahellaceae bacterium]|nr:YdcH family protein [Hahellaceae bacterium]MCP5170565.1 YdcH family protein [Hahellaceae bacterium]